MPHFHGVGGGAHQITDKSMDMIRSETGTGVGAGGSGGSAHYDDWDEEILIDQTDLESKIGMIRDLEMKNQELKSESDFHLVQKEKAFQNIMKKQTDDFEREMKIRDKKIDELKKDLEHKEKKHLLEGKEREEMRKKDTSDLDFQYTERITSILNEKREVQKQKEEEINELVRKGDEEDFFNEEEKRRIKIKNQEEGKEKKEQINEIVREKVEKEKDHKEMLKLTKRRYNVQLDKIEDEYERKLRKAKQENENLMEEKKKKTSNEEKYDKDIKTLEKQIEKKKDELEDERSEYERMDRTTKSVQKENQEREDTIAEKERRIVELNKQNNELKKFKFVLSYKIQTLKNEINPNNLKIKGMAKELKRYNKELDNYKKNKNKLKNYIMDLDRKITGNSSELKNLKRKYEEISNYKTRILHDLNLNIYQNLSAEKTLKKKVIQFYHKYVANVLGKRTKRNSSGDSYDNDDSNDIFQEMDIQKELNRKRVHLEKTVQSLKRKLIKATNTTKQETMRIMHENVMLINEINQLRKELRYLNRKLHEKEDPGVHGDGQMKKSRSGIEKIMSRLRRGNLGTGMLKEQAYRKFDLEEAERELEMQTLHIGTLRKKVAELEDQRNRSRSRSGSRGSTRKSTGRKSSAGGRRSSRARSAGSRGGARPTSEGL